jgi:integrase
MINPFMGVYYDNKQGVTVRQPIPIDDIRLVQNICMETDDDIRWLVAMVADTGMRLAEAAGLHKSDIHLDGDVPFIRLQPHPWRRLKTTGSYRPIGALENQITFHVASLKCSRSQYSHQNP